MRFRSRGPSLVAFTPAKLNLYLDVLGRRPDGYHELETVMVSIGLYDTLLFTEDASHETRLRCHHAGPQSSRHAPRDERHQIDVDVHEPSPPSGSTRYAERDGYRGADNLIVRAAELLRETTGCDRGVTIDLWKRIPIRAGLGGGSSDAAATLVGLNRFWRLGLETPRLHQLASQLGSDVNFFLDSHIAAIGTGRGETIRPLRVPQRLHFVVVSPKSGLSTGDVFRQWQKETETSPSAADVMSRLARGRLATVWNALEAPARVLNSEIGETLDGLRSAGAAVASMSGSGTSCFALCRTARQARTMAGRIARRNPGRTFVVDSRA